MAAAAAQGQTEAGEDVKQQNQKDKAESLRKELTMKQNRLKSKYVWVAVLAQIMLVLGLYMPSVSNEVKIIGTAVIEIFTLVGVLNNPANKKEW